MIGQMENSTALLATTFGSMLLLAQRGGAVPQTTAQDLIVLARVLENRLAEVRRTLAEAIERPVFQECAA